MIESGIRNEIFNISANNKMTNVDVIKTVFSWYNKEMNENTVKYVENRLGQDVRYSIDNSKALNMLNWKPLHNNGLYKFVK